MSTPRLTILTGFLGAGKTTILNQMLQSGGAADTGVIINEAGDGIDHLIVEDFAGGVTLLDNGCLCCRSKGHLASAISSLIARRREMELRAFERIVVETSGLANPASLLQEIILDPFIGRATAFAGVVTAVDALTFGQESRAGSPFLSQIALADRLLVTKQDLVTPAALKAVQAEIAAINPHAPQVVVTSGLADDSIWPDALGLFVSPSAGGRPPEAESTPQIAIASLTFEGEIAARDLEEWIEHTIMLFGAALLRLKAILDVSGYEAPAVIHGVQGYLHSPGALKAWPHGKRANRAVLIGEGVEKVLLDDALSRLRSLAAPDFPVAVHAIHNERSSHGTSIQA